MSVGEGLKEKMVGSMFPRFYSLPEERKKSWMKWSKSLNVKVLGKSVVFRALEQRLKEMWDIHEEFELLDLDGGFFLVRF